MSNRKYQDLSVTQRDSIAWLAIDRPRKLNTLTRRTLDELIAACDELEHEDSVRAVVLTGSGDRAFSAGIYVDEMRDMDAVKCDEFTRRESQAYRAVLLMKKPTIAAVNGYALGGGCVLALAADIRIASEKAIFGLTELNMGAPVPIEAALLPLLIGHGRAREMVYTARHVKADEALAMGLCSQVTAANGLAAAAQQLAAEIARHDPGALRAQKEIMTKWMTTDLITAIDYSVGLTSVVFASGSPRRAISGFIERRRAAHEQGDTPR